MIYLASPYYHKDPGIRRERLRAVTKKAAQIQLSSKNVYSPMTHNYPIFVRMRGKGSGWETWKHHDLEMLSFCSELFVLTLPGWEKSEGIKEEMRFAKALGININLIDP